MERAMHSNQYACVPHVIGCIYTSVPTCVPHGGLSLTHLIDDHMRLWVQIHVKCCVHFVACPYMYMYSLKHIRFRLIIHHVDNSNAFTQRNRPILASAAALMTLDPLIGLKIHETRL